MTCGGGVTICCCCWQPLPQPPKTDDRSRVVRGVSMTRTKCIGCAAGSPFVDRLLRSPAGVVARMQIVEPGLERETQHLWYRLVVDPQGTVVGGGMAGSEAAWQLAEAGVDVALVEMKPCAMSPAHQSPLLGELVCSNSFRSDNPVAPAGLLKHELRRCGSMVIQCADEHRVPAGPALAGGRVGFAPA